MAYLEGSSIKDFVVDEILDKLDEYEGVSSYGADLAYTLFEGENADGSMTYSRQASIDWIKEHFGDIGEVWDELVANFGSDYMSKFNPFDNPEQFQVVIVLEVASYLLGQCKTVEDNWDNEMTLDEKNIENIKKEIQEV